MIIIWSFSLLPATEIGGAARGDKSGIDFKVISIGYNFENGTHSIMICCENIFRFEVMFMYLLKNILTYFEKTTVAVGMALVCGRAGSSLRLQRTRAVKTGRNATTIASARHWKWKLRDFRMIPQTMRTRITVGVGTSGILVFLNA